MRLGQPAEAGDSGGRKRCSWIFDLAEMRVENANTFSHDKTLQHGIG